MSNCDPRIVYGACCCWWESINKVAINKVGLPCCPYCHSVLLEVENEKKWWDGVAKYEAKGHPGYRKFIEWQRGKCYKTLVEAAEDYKLHTGQEVKL